MTVSVERLITAVEARIDETKKSIGEMHGIINTGYFEQRLQWLEELKTELKKEMHSH